MIGIFYSDFKIRTVKTLAKLSLASYSYKKRKYFADHLRSTFTTQPDIVYILQLSKTFITAKLPVKSSFIPNNVNRWLNI